MDWQDVAEQLKETLAGVDNALALLDKLLERLEDAENREIESLLMCDMLQGQLDDANYRLFYRSI